MKQRYSAVLALGMIMAGLITFLTETLRAESQQGPGQGPGGFRPGSKPFQNPFANSAAGQPSHPVSDPFFDDDDEDDEDASPFGRGGHPVQQNMQMHSPPPSQKLGQQGGSAAAPTLNAPSSNTPSSTFPALTTTKTAPVSAVKPIQINNETGSGEGSKEIITDFNFPDADILDIAKTLGKLTGKNFIYDNKDVKGRITIVSNGAITVATAWKAFLTALDVTGFALVESGNYLRITRARDAKDKQLTTYTGDSSPNTDALIIRVFQLKYISPDDVAKTFRNFMPPSSRIVPYESTNSVIVTDTGANIDKMAKMLQLLDVEGYDAGIEVIPVKFASAAELSKLIDNLLPGTNSGGTGSGGSRFGGGGKFSSRRTKEGGIVNNIIADERTNTLIVHANAKGTDQVRELVAKLDHKYPSPVGGGRVHVVYLEFADAEQLANTLNNFSQQSNSSSNRSSSGAGSGTGVNPIAQTLFEGSVKISPDKATNSLVITASASDFVTIQRVINRLDIPRNQVYVEVVIMEVAISHNFQYSANIVSAPSLMGSVTSSSDLNSAFSANPFSANGALLSFKAGQNYNLTMGGQTITVSSVMGMIKALQSNADTNTLATPQIIALDNTEAMFETADKIPTSSGQTITATGLGQQQIVKEPVILSIKIKPQINKATNFIKLDVTTKLGDINNVNVPAALQGQTFQTQDRTAQTSVVVADHDTIVLGGLIRDRVSESVVKIPILGDIPLLGWLFKSKSSDVQKRNLLIFMTPHIISQYEKIRPILDKKLKERDDFIEHNAGGEDPFRGYRDDMIRALPDMNEIIKKQPQRTFTIDEEKSTTNPTPPTGTDTHSAAPGIPTADPTSPPPNPEDRISPPAPQPEQENSAPPPPAQPQDSSPPPENNPPPAEPPPPAAEAPAQPEGGE